MKRIFAWRRFGRVLLLGVVVIALCALFSFGVNGLFTIENVEVHGDGIQIEIDKTKLSSNLLFFPSDQEIELLRKEYPLIKSVSIQKKFPHTLVITFTTRKPFAIVGIGSERYSLDEEGIVLRQYPDEINLPAIYIAVSGLVPGTKVTNPGIVNAVQLMHQMVDSMKILDIRVHDSTALLAQTEQMSILFSQHADIPKLIHTLQTMISGFRIKGKLPIIIDLRFDKPVITY